MGEGKGSDRTMAGNVHWKCEHTGLAPALMTALEAAAAEFRAAGHAPLRVASGRRTLRRQAELMAAMSPDQLRGLYARHGTPDYIARILAEHAAVGHVAPETVYEILRTRNEGFISAHLCGAAVDLVPPDTPEAGAALRRALERHGFEVLDERDLGLECLHARLAGLPLEIVRE